MHDSTLKVRRIRDPDARREILLLRLRLVEFEQARHRGNRVERLLPGRERNLLVDVIHSQIKGQIRSDFPVVLSKQIQELLVAEVIRNPDRALSKARLNVAQIE